MAQPIQLIGDPDNQHPDKWNSALYLRDLWYVSFSRCRILYIKNYFSIVFCYVTPYRKDLGQYLDLMKSSSKKENRRTFSENIKVRFDVYV